MANIFVYIKYENLESSYLELKKKLFKKSIDLHFLKNIKKIYLLLINFKNYLKDSIACKSSGATKS